MPACSDTNLLSRLLHRGDIVSIENGRSVIVPGSGKPLPEGWLEAHSEQLCSEILKATALDAYRYDSYSTGKYGDHKAQGLTLQLVSVMHGQEAYCIFNASLKRLRGPQKGSSLPRGQFRVGKRSHFYKFWVKTGLKLPDRLCHFHNYMGNLRQLILTCEGGGERLAASTLRPLNLGAESIKRLVLPPNCHPTATQLSHPRIRPKLNKQAGHSQIKLRVFQTTVIR